MKKILSLALAFAVFALLLTGCNAPQEQGQEVLPNLMVMAGPTGVGAAKLLTDHANAAENEKILASATVVENNEDVTSALINGEADIAAVATNVASMLYNKTGGNIQVLALNTMGVLYILEKGNSVNSMADLKGKTVYDTGKGANPEYVLNYLLTASGVAVEEVDIQWMTAQEVTAAMTTNSEAICMLPVPAATALMIKDSEVRQAISLSAVWDQLGNGALSQGCIVVRKDYAEKNPQAVANFLKAYEASIAYMNEEANRADAAALVAQHGITANAAIAAKAIPQCNLTYITGSRMKEILSAFLAVMHTANPASIGGALPGDDFYYAVG